MLAGLGAVQKSYLSPEGGGGVSRGCENCVRRGVGFRPMREKKSSHA